MKSKLSLGSLGQLFDMVNDPNQTKNIGETKPKVLADFSKAKENYRKRWLIESY